MSHRIPISLNDALELDLFEDIKFGELKMGDTYIFDKDTDYYDLFLDIEVESNVVKDISAYMCSCKITFELNDKKYEKIYEYHNSSPMALTILNLYDMIEEWNEEEEEENKE